MKKVMYELYIDFLVNNIICIMLLTFFLIK